MFNELTGRNVSKACYSLVFFDHSVQGYVQVLREKCKLVKVLILLFLDHWNLIFLFV